MCFAPKIPKDNSADLARQQEEQRQTRIKEGRGKIDEAFQQFNDPWYESQKTNYASYYEPQVQDQFEDARQKLIYGLSRTGNLNAGTGAERLGDLQKAFDLQRGAISGQAIDYAGQIRSSVENAKSDLYSQNQASADPSAAASSAMARAGALQTPPSMSPLGQLFSDFTNLATMGVMAEAKGYPGLKTGLFNSPKNAVTVVN